MRIKLENYLALTAATMSSIYTNAEIVYTDPNPDIDVASSFSIDLNNDGVNDYSFNYYKSNQYYSFAINGIYNASVWIDVDGWSPYFAANFYQGDTIVDCLFTSSSINTCYFVNGAPIAGYGNVNVGWSTTKQISIDTATLALKFEISGSWHYGWLRVTGDTLAGFKILDYAYESCPNEYIIAGAVSGGSLSCCPNGLTNIYISNYQYNVPFDTSFCGYSYASYCPDSNLYQYDKLSIDLNAFADSNYVYGISAYIEITGVLDSVLHNGSIVALGDTFSADSTGSIVFDLKHLASVIEWTLHLTGTPTQLCDVYSKEIVYYETLGSCNNSFGYSVNQTVQELTPWHFSFHSQNVIDGVFNNTGVVGDSVMTYEYFNSTVCDQPDTIGVDDNYESYTWNTGDSTNQIVVSSSGTYILYIQDSNSCMEIHKYTVEINSSSINAQSISGNCVVNYNGVDYYSSTTISDTLYGANMYGCDSIIQSVINVNTNLYSNQTINGNCMVQFMNNTYYSDTIIYDTISIGPQGCDSIIQTNIVVNQVPANGQIDVDGCGEVVYNNMTYTSSTTLNYVFQGASYLGCDSNLTVNINVKPIVVNSTNLEFCDTAFIAGQSFLSDTILSDTIENSNSCTEEQIVISVNYYSESNLDSTLYLGDTLIVGSQVITSDFLGDIQTKNKENCDSIIHANITFNDSINSVGKSLKDEGKVYPNPFNQLIYISNIQRDLVEVEVFDVLGQRLEVEIEQFGKDLQLSTSVFEDGVYFLQIKDESGKVILRKKLIRN